MSALFRIYEPWECGPDGYPLAWHKLDEQLRWTGGEYDQMGVKDIVRAQAGHRCIRCGHPYRVGESGVWADGADVTRLPGTRTFFDNLDPPLMVKAHRQTLWSACDEHCTHGGPTRWRDPESAEKGRSWLSGREDVEARTYVQGGHLVEAAWRILTVHHLNGRKHDLRWFNLVALDQRCHLLVQRKVVMDRAYPWDHTAWFRPYVAGFYAYKYLGEELSREETMERLDELLALGKREEAVERMPL